MTLSYNRKVVTLTQIISILSECYIGLRTLSIKELFYSFTLRYSPLLARDSAYTSSHSHTDMDHCAQLFQRRE
jgi:hypothetical protein